MMHMNRTLGFGIVLTVMLFGPSFADDARELMWDELIPEGDLQQPGYGAGSVDHSGSGNDWDKSFSVPAYAASVVEELDGIQAKIPGFIVPLELADEGKLKEFLLVPYFGACIHFPPPPPNQIVYVILDEPLEIESPWEPIWATGELKTESRGSDFGSAGYTMAGHTIEEYEY